MYWQNWREKQSHRTQLNQIYIQEIETTESEKSESKKKKIQWSHTRL